MDCGQLKILLGVASNSYQKLLHTKNTTSAALTVLHFYKPIYHASGNTIHCHQILIKLCNVTTTQRYSRQMELAKSCVSNLQEEVAATTTRSCSHLEMIKPPANTCGQSNNNVSQLFTVGTHGGRLTASQGAVWKGRFSLSS